MKQKKQGIIRTIIRTIISKIKKWWDCIRGKSTPTITENKDYSDDYSNDYQ